MTKELIKIEKKNDVECVSARELYAGLNNGNVSDYARWARRNITGSIFFEENKDWAVVQQVTERKENAMFNPNPTTDYAITINMAEHLCMMSNTQTGKRYRDYFIACEKKLKQVYRDIKEGLENGTYMKLTPRDKYRMMYAVTVDNMIGMNQMIDLIRKTYSFYSVANIDKFLKDNGYITAAGKPTSRADGFIGQCYNPVSQRMEIRFTKKGAERFINDYLDIDLPLNPFPESHITEDDLKGMQGLWQKTVECNMEERAHFELRKKKIALLYGTNRF